MSWPQNPEQPQQPAQPQNPQPPQGGFGPPPVWGPEGTGHAEPTMVSQPAVPAPPAPGPEGSPHAQPTMIAQPAMPSPPGPVGGAGAVPPPPPPGPVGGAGAVPPPPAPGPVYGHGHGPVPGPQSAPPMATAPMPHLPQQPGPAQPPAQPKSRTLLAIVGGVVALAVIGGGVAFALQGGGKKSDDAKGAGQASEAPAQQPSQAPAAPDGSAAPGASAAPMVAGWQTQNSETHHFSYDVPGKADNWKVLPPETAIAYTKDGKPLVTMSGAANFHEGGCASRNDSSIGEAGKGQLAQVGVQGGAKDTPPEQAAYNVAGNWGFAAYGGLNGHKPEMKVGKAVPWKHNGIDGFTSTAEVTLTNRASSCVPPKAVVHSIAQKLPNGEVHVWVIYADQGVPDALTPDQIEKIMNTVRPFKKSGA
ncbi:hypothetical protein FHS39_003718 [Streptomyces olivoverticillatus]|uniref:DUF8017 domain-containing protein n=1 Tax=Streptomyces olivoverticillatus TaxID=66427 RepID=A0A7W7LQN4_9ACTN|nr:hypothetical protein [Streptomyces olivoverticillatus]MBB4894660.1 hypothetical protein [Streptomyces olivoverticillatus]